ncbi:MAG: MBL fold metallo-hydrolase [Anaerolineales bacterium]|jgi:L-ascorbate metabolism protein UlaG (beta-lactamase superfamily)
MEITWYGHSCFRLTERGLASVVTDPFDDTIGYSTLRLKADVVTVSHDAPGHGNVDAVKGEKRILRGPGEFEIGGVFITGVATRRAASAQESKKKTPERAIENTLFLFDFDGLNVAHLGDLNYVPSQQQIESLGAVDVLLVPVGGGGALTASQAAEMVSLLEPSVVVPMHYKTPEVEVKLDSLNKFLKEMGLSGIKPLDSLKVGHSDLPDETRVVVLDYKRG